MCTFFINCNSFYLCIHTLTDFNSEVKTCTLYFFNFKLNLYTERITGNLGRYYEKCIYLTGISVASYGSIFNSAPTFQISYVDLSEYNVDRCYVFWPSNGSDALSLWLWATNSSLVIQNCSFLEPSQHLGEHILVYWSTGLSDFKLLHIILFTSKAV